MSEFYIFDTQPVREHDYPYYHEVHFEWFFETAYSELENRSSSEIAQLVFDVDRFTAEQLRYLSGLNTPEELIKNYRELYPGRTQAISLQHSMNQDESLAQISDVQGVTWKECFAAALLGQAIWAVREEKRLKGNEFTEQDQIDLAAYDLGEYLGFYAINCMELLMVLSAMSGSGYKLVHEVVTKDMSRKRKASAVKAAGERHRPARELKERYINWFYANEASGLFHSKRQAAEKFHSSLTQEEKRIVTTPNTFVKALRAYEKS